MRKESFLRSILAIVLSYVLVPAPIALGGTTSNTPAQSYPNDAVFLGPRTAHHAVVSGKFDKKTIEDSARNRRLWMQQRTAGLMGREFVRHMMREAEKQRGMHPDLMAGAEEPNFKVPRWRSIGPTRANFLQNGPFTLNRDDSGRARTILLDPKDDDTVYFLTSGGGLWKTTNFDEAKPTWVSKTDSLLTTSGGSVAMGRNRRTLYLGLGDPFADPTEVSGVMVKSTDGGDHWSPFVPLGFSNSVRDVKVDTSGPQDIVLVGTDAGMFRSTDGGNTYNQVAGAAPSDAFFNKMVWSIARTKAGWLAVAQTFSFVFERNFGFLEQVGFDASLLLSTDQGATWNAINNAGNVFTGAGRTTLAVAKPGDSVVYAFAATTGDGAQLDLFRSIDGGQNWTALGLPGKVPTNPNGDQPDMDVMHTQAFYNHMVLVDPTDEDRNTVYLGGNFSSVKSTDGGNTWTVLSNWITQFGLPYVHADFHAAAMLIHHDLKTLIFGTDGGLFTSRDGGLTWNDDKNEGLVTHLIYALTSNPGTPDSTLMGLQDDGSRLRVGDTRTYNQTLGGDGFATGWSQANNAVSIATIDGGIIANCMTNPPDDISKWNLAITGIDINDANFSVPIDTPSAAADPTGLVFFNTTNHHIYMTTDGANTWNLVGTSGVNGIGPHRLVRAVLHSVGISPSDVNTVGVTGSGGNLLLTHNAGAANNGALWTEIPLIALVPGYPGFNSHVAFANGTKTIYVSTEAPLFGVVRVVKSTDGGLTWAAAANGLPDVPINKLQVDVKDPSGNTVYAATMIGVFQTTDGGNSWNLFGAGFPQVVATDLYMPPNGSFLRVSTYGRGVWEVRLSREHED
jgi:photosystem II stability/assembly factor-like uncharacterized protein